MRTPIRRAERNKLTQADYHLTPAAITKLQSELVRIETKELPRASAEVQRTGAFGDFSENAEYQFAKAKLRGLLDRATHIKKQLRNAITIEERPRGAIDIGSTVQVETDGKVFVYQIVGSAETDPKSGRISYLSHLGQALLGHKAGQVVNFKTPSGKNLDYKILKTS
jgi:transcription elongation factor GreA